MMLVIHMVFLVIQVAEVEVVKLAQVVEEAFLHLEVMVEAMQPKLQLPCLLHDMRPTPSPCMRTRLPSGRST